MNALMKTLLMGLWLGVLLTARADPVVYGGELQGFEYPAPVAQFPFTSQGQAMHMAYLDYQPTQANGHSVVLLHGKNFCASSWHDTAVVLQQAGFRVIVPDQIGFCKSSKPDGYRYSFEQLADNTHALLGALHINQATVIGHSMGGMLATRYALRFASAVEQLVLLNPLGLEDWKALGVPALTHEEWLARELAFSEERLRDYERNTYYAGEWKEEYEPYVQVMAGMFRGPARQTLALHSAWVYQMIFEQPVVQEFSQLQVPTLLMVGAKDSSALGKDWAPASLKSQLGHYRAMALRAVKTIPSARLVLFPDLGHAPHIQNFERFITALVNSLSALDKD